jgi:hypothetical protein
LFSLSERAALAVNSEDLYVSFLYQVGIMMEDHPVRENESTRHVECTWVGHYYQNHYDVVEKCGGNLMKVKEYMDENGGPTIMNYRFIRNYTKGEEDDSWTINALNHFKLLDPSVPF